MAGSRRSGQIIPRESLDDPTKCRKWMIRVFLGRVAGRKQYASQIIHGTRKDAQKVLTAKLAERDAGKFAGKARQTVDEFLDVWLRDMAPMTRKPRTLLHDTRLIRTYVRPYLGGTKLGDLSPLDVQHWYRQLSERGLSAKTIRLSKNLLSQALSAAVHPYRLIPFNPVAGTKSPRLRKREMRVYSPEEAIAFLRASKGHPREALFALMICCGLRPSEALGLQRRDVDLDAGMLTINRVLVCESGGPEGRLFAYDEDPKTDNSRRTLYIPEPALRLLTEHMTRSPFQGWTDPVFHGPDGQPLDERNVARKNFKPLARKAGLPSIRLYDLRHTHATLMHRAGVDAKVYGAGMGHKSIQVTLDTYTHVLPAVKRDAVNKFEAFMQQADMAPAPRPAPALDRREGRATIH